MTTDERLHLVGLIEGRFRTLQTLIEAVDHKVDALRAENAEDHKAVVGRLDHLAERVSELETGERIDEALEQERSAVATTRKQDRKDSKSWWLQVVVVILGVEAATFAIVEFLLR